MSSLEAAQVVHKVFLAGGHRNNAKINPALGSNVQNSVGDMQISREKLLTNAAIRLVCLFVKCLLRVSESLKCLLHETTISHRDTSKCNKIKQALNCRTNGPFLVSFFLFYPMGERSNPYFTHFSGLKYFQNGLSVKFILRIS